MQTQIRLLLYFFWYHLKYFREIVLTSQQSLLLQKFENLSQNYHFISCEDSLLYLLFSIKLTPYKTLNPINAKWALLPHSSDRSISNIRGHSWTLAVQPLKQPKQNSWICQQCRSRWDGSSWATSSGSTLFAFSIWNISWNFADVNFVCFLGANFADVNFVCFFGCFQD